MNKIKIYRGYRKDGIPIVEVEEIDLTGVNTRMLENTKRHGSDFFEWGYSGAGPSDLARAILLDMKFPKKEVDSLYQDFKYAFILPADFDGFEISEDSINAWWDFKHHNEKEEEDEEGGGFDGFL
ncbi:MAG: hypothetical protein E2O29_01605 [Deltaproteobacteria bacterium]|nr:MAG: hypothetical protein E2O29_01605 [Deltaproteobacteria bacterium]